MTRSDEDDAIARDIQALRGNANVIRERMGPIIGEELDYDERSVRSVQQRIEYLRTDEQFRHEPPSELLNMLGAFLGECIIVNFGGAWAWSEEFGTYVVLFPGPNRNLVNPIGKVWKQYENGVEGGDGIAGFYQVAGTIARGAFDSYTTRTATPGPGFGGHAAPAAEGAHARAANLPLVYPQYRLLFSVIGGLVAGFAIVPFIVTLLDVGRGSSAVPIVCTLVSVSVSFVLWFKLGPRKAGGT